AVLDEGNASTEHSRSGRYRLGIECDGDNYHLARSARDRDRIQAQVLARLGWRIHRVWSQQWWQDPEAELEKLLAAIQVLQSEITLEETAVQPIARYEIQPTFATPHPIPAYTRYAGRIELGKHGFYNFYASQKENRQQLLKWMCEIIEREGPIHVDELRRTMSYAAGYQQMTLDDTVAHWLVKQGKKAGLFAEKSEFLYRMGKRPLVRDRSQITGVSRKFSYIAPEEIEEAVILVVQDAMGIAVDEIPLLVARLLGFRQVSGKSKTAVLDAVARVVGNGRVVQHRGQLFIGN
ncbi:MAG: DUF3320 domain-containing protein, partial [Chloroflexi bacterium]|nr:DUF3320 domain-containing protein [Chloroflexota bacterium]